MTLHKIRRLILLPVILILGLACSLLSPGTTPQTPSAGATAPSAAPSITQPPAAGGKTPQAPASATAPGASKSTSQPARAVAGLKLVYAKEGSLWLWADGQARQLTSSGSDYFPRLSADGQVVAYLRPADDFHVELWAVNAAGGDAARGDERRLVSVSDLNTIGGGVRDPSAVAVNPFHYDWVPASHTLAFNTYQAFQGPGSSLLNDLNLVDAGSLKITTLLLSGWGGEFVYSPDGKHIALSTDSKVILADADGKNYRKVLDYTPVTTYSEARYYAHPLWSSDGAFLRLAIPPADPLASPAQPTNLWKIPAGDGPAVLEGSLRVAPLAESLANSPVSYSPDLKRIAYLVETGQPSDNLRELHLATYDGAGGWVYQKAALLKFASWSPDGDHFAFTTGEEPQMWLGSIQSAALPFSADPSGLMRLRWVDNRECLYLRERSGLYEFYLASLDGRETLIDTLPQPPDYDFVDLGAKK